MQFAFSTRNFNKKAIYFNYSSIIQVWNYYEVQALRFIVKQAVCICFSFQTSPCNNSVTRRHSFPSVSDLSLLSTNAYLQKFEVFRGIKVEKNSHLVEVNWEENLLWKVPFSRLLSCPWGFVNDSDKPLPCKHAKPESIIKIYLFLFYCCFFANEFWLANCFWYMNYITKKRRTVYSPQQTPLCIEQPGLKPIVWGEEQRGFTWDWAWRLTHSLDIFADNSLSQGILNSISWV